MKLSELVKVISDYNVISVHHHTEDNGYVELYEGLNVNLANPKLNSRYSDILGAEVIAVYNSTMNDPTVLDEDPFMYVDCISIAVSQ